MRKLFILASLLIIVPFAAYAGEGLGWWNFVHDWDIFAHGIVSLGLALGIGLTLKKYDLPPSYLMIIILVILIGITWETIQFIVVFKEPYIINFEAMKDLGVDTIGAMIGATIVRK